MRTCVRACVRACVAGIHTHVRTKETVLELVGRRLQEKKKKRTEDKTIIKKPTIVKCMLEASAT